MKASKAARKAAALKGAATHKANATAKKAARAAAPVTTPAPVDGNAVAGPLTPRAAAVAAAVAATPVTRPPASRSVDGGPAPLPTYAVDPARRREPKPGTYRALIIQMLLVGATMSEVRTATGWNKRQAREGVRLLHYKCGYGITENPVTRVITVDGGPAVAPAAS